MLFIVVFIAILIILFYLISGFCYIYAFKAASFRIPGEFSVPNGFYKKKAIENIKKLLETPFEDVSITSKDSLRLYGRYYHFSDNAPVAVMFHGYRSNYCRDASGGFHLARERKMNILIPDQRAHGKSEGNTITFGIKERYDCLCWIKYLKNRFGKDVKIVLVGLSMGASTVVMASDIVPKENVMGIIADCGFSSPKEILTEVAGQMGLPKKIAYFFTRMGAKIFGRFDPEESSSVESVAKTDIPILFIHGEDDGFVPAEMTKLCYEKCKSYKKLLLVPKATHGTSFYYDTIGYKNEVKEFFDYVLN